MIERVLLIPNFGIKSLLSMLPLAPRPCYYKPCNACTAQCAQYLSHIMSTSLRSKPCVLMRACVHQVLDAHALAIMRLATSTSDMNKHKPRVAPNTSSPACHIYSAKQKPIFRHMPLPSPFNLRLEYYLH